MAVNQLFPQSRCGCTSSFAHKACPAGHALRAEASRLYHIMNDAYGTDRYADAEVAWVEASELYEFHVQDGYGSFPATPDSHRYVEGD